MDQEAMLLLEFLGVRGFLSVSTSFLKPQERLRRKGRAFQTQKHSWE